MNRRARIGTIHVQHAIAIAAWRAADPATRGAYPVDPTVAPSNGTTSHFDALSTIRNDDRKRAAIRDAGALKRSRDALGLPRDDAHALRQRRAS